MLSIVIVGYGAIASYLAANCPDGARIDAVICRPGREHAARAGMGDIPLALTVESFADKPDLIVECAGHSGLRSHGVDALRSGIEVVTASVGALSDEVLETALHEAALQGGTRLSIASGAIGALDALAAASQGGELQVTYQGRKPPPGWRGSRAEEVLDLSALDAPQTHFEGSAREAARLYPKNANVAAAVALAGAGFDDTRTRLIADPTISRNIHEIEAEGAFGRFRFEIEGLPLPGNPKSSALTAMSLLRAIRGRLSPVQI